jgi:hypothetical protein
MSTQTLPEVSETPAAIPVSRSTGAPGVVPISVPARTPVTRGPRRVRLTVSRIDPWSVMKLAFLLSVAVGIMSVVATIVFWFVVDGLHVFATIQEFINDALGGTGDVDVTQYFALTRIVSLSVLVSIVNVVLMTAIAAIMAILYNITAALVGGLRLTLTDD